MTAPVPRETVLLTVTQSNGPFDHPGVERRLGLSDVLTRSLELVTASFDPFDPANAFERHQTALFRRFKPGGTKVFSLGVEGVERTF